MKNRSFNGNRFFVTELLYIKYLLNIFPNILLYI